MKMDRYHQETRRVLGFIPEWKEKMENGKNEGEVNGSYHYACLAEHLSSSK